MAYLVRHLSSPTSDMSRASLVREAREEPSQRILRGLAGPRLGRFTLLDLRPVFSFRLIVFLTLVSLSIRRCRYGPQSEAFPGVEEILHDLKTERIIQVRTAKLRTQLMSEIDEAVM